MTIAGELIRLRSAPLEDLRTRYRELSGADFKGRSRDVLLKRIAFHIQSDGGGTPATVTAAPSPDRTARATVRKPRKGSVALGTVIVRRWHEVEYRITVVEGGYSLDGVVFKSASALARHVTQQHWNGRLWLGLAQRSKAPKR